MLNNEFVKVANKKKKRQKHFIQKLVKAGLETNCRTCIQILMWYLADILGKEKKNMWNNAITSIHLNLTRAEVIFKCQTMTTYTKLYAAHKFLNKSWKLGSKFPLKDLLTYEYLKTQ